MANGRTHDMVANAVIILGGVAAFKALPLATATVVTAGLVIGKYANPDVRDQPKVRNHAEHLVDRHFGCLIGALWTAYWLPLASRMPRHRHPASHLPGFATIIACVYMFWPLVALVGAFAPSYLLVTLLIIAWTLPGWILQDFAHLVWDGFGIRW